MRQQKEVWQRALEEFAAESRRHLKDHPPEEELDLFAKGGLGEDRREDIRDHIAVCPQCLRGVLEQKTFPLLEAPSGGPDLTDEQIEIRWQAVRRKLISETASSRKPSGAWLPGPKPSGAYTAIIALAAVAVTVFIGLTVLRARFGTWWPNGDRPEVNTQIVSLMPNESGPPPVARGEESAIQTVLTPQSANSILLVLNVPSLEDFSAYKAQLFERGSDDLLWEDSSIRRTANLNFNVSFPRSVLPEGEYVVRLWGESEPDSILIAHYQFRVVRRSDSLAGER